MLRALVCLSVGLAFCVGGLLAADKPDAGKAVRGTVKKVDADKNTITITGKDGTEQTFSVAADVKVSGPKGTASDKGLKDERLKEGAQVSVMTGPGGQTAREIRLAGKKGADK